MTLPSRDPVHGTPTRQSARELDAAEQPVRARTPVSNPQRSDLQPSDPNRSQVPGMPIMPVTDTANRASWENSRGGRQQTISAHPPSSAWKAILLIAAGAAALLALGIFIWFSRRSETAQSVTPVLSAAAVEIAPAPAGPATETVATAAAPSPPSPSIEAIGKAGAGAAPEPSANASAETARPNAGPTSVREPAPEWRTRKSAPSAPSPAPSGKGLTDFGGRR